MSNQNQGGSSTPTPSPLQPHPNPTGQETKKESEKFDGSYTGKRKIVEQEFTYSTHTDPARKIPGTAVYLDDVQREQAEIVRAKAEGREPDLKNAPATQGTPLRPTHVIRAELPGDAVVEADKKLDVAIGNKR